MREGVTVEQTTQSCDVNVEQTWDVAYLDSVLRHPQIYPGAMGPLAVDPSRMTNAKLVNDPRVRFWRCMLGKVDLGWIMTVEMVPRIFDIHPAGLPVARGRIGLIAANQLLNILFQCLDAECVRGFTPIDNRPAIWAAAACGMHYRGRTRTAGPCGVDVVISELSRSEWLLE
jgi:hypothetical protein